LKGKYDLVLEKRKGDLLDWAKEKAVVRKEACV